MGGRQRFRAVGRQIGTLTALLSLVSTLVVASPIPARAQPLRSIYVDGSSGSASDANPGTSHQPLKTILAAAHLAQANQRASIGTEIVIRAGVYRESVEMTGSPSDPAVPITFVGKGNVVVTGSDPWAEGWTQGTAGTYSHAWPYAWGLAPYPATWSAISGLLDANPIVRRREMLFMNGRPLAQEMSLRDVQDDPGSFVVSETTGTVTIRPRAGVDVRTTPVEVAVRPHLFLFEGMKNVTLRNITFEHANTPLEVGHAVAFIGGSSGITIHDCRFLWNNWTGLGLTNVSDANVNDSVMNHNGIGGMQLYRVRDGAFTNDVTSFNNWRGFAGGFTDWTSGQKLSGLRNVTITNLTTVGNQTHGLWLDYDNANVTIRGLVSRGNLLDGLVVEASQGPTTVDGAWICGNRRGVMAEHAENVRMQGTRLLNNRDFALVITGLTDSLRPVVDWQTGQTMMLSDANWDLKRNTIAGKGLVWGTLAPKFWNLFTGSLSSDNNRWASSDGQAFVAPGPTTLKFAAWKATTGQDRHSTFNAPGVSGACGRRARTNAP